MFVIGLYKIGETCSIPRKWRYCDDVTRVTPYSKELLMLAEEGEFAFAQDLSSSMTDGYDISGEKTNRRPAYLQK